MGGINHQRLVVYSCYTHISCCGLKIRRGDLVPRWQWPLQSTPSKRGDSKHSYSKVKPRLDTGVEIKLPNMLSVTNNDRQNMFPSHIGPQVGILKATKVMETRKPRNGKLEQQHHCPWDPLGTLVTLVISIWKFWIQIFARKHRVRVGKDIPRAGSYPLYGYKVWLHVQNQRAPRTSLNGSLQKSKGQGVVSVSIQLDDPTIVSSLSPSSMP